MTSSVIDKLFAQLTVIYPYKFAGQFNDAAVLPIAKSEWGKGLRDLTQEQIERGLHLCRTCERDWPPSISEFRKMCLPTAKELGVLDRQEALQSFLRKDFSNPIVEAVKYELDGFAFRRANVKEANEMFYKAYEQCVNNYLQSMQSTAISNR